MIGASPGEETIEHQKKMNGSGSTAATVTDANVRTETIEQPSANQQQSESNTESTETKGGVPGDCPASPQVQAQPYQQVYLPHLTPQAGGGYYLYGNHQVTPEPPSPATPGYDVASFLQQQAALGVHPGNPFGTGGQYGAMPQAPLSPSRSGMSGGLIPPASPLFPRVATNSAGGISGSFEQHNQLDSAVLQRIQGQTPASPSVPYVSASLISANGSGFGAMYPGYSPTGTYANVLSGAANQTTESSPPTGENGGWGDRKNPQQLPYAQASPQAQGLPSPYGGGMSRSGSNNRSYSFEEMLPPSILDPQDQASAPYSPYSNNQGASANTLMTHQQPWAYGAPGDMYNPPQSPLQPRNTPGQFSLPGMGASGMHPMSYASQPHIAPFYPATSPGPPIQTTASNKGPDGANLFIFHIPNHFTNLDMYRLFCQYGNLLSVRIMVEKDTGRSRGFGFVSYDSPESAALAIKELNGFAIGNKRLKVQHKQIRGDQQRSNFNGSTHSGDPSFMPRPELVVTGGPPTNAGISSSPWYDASSKQSTSVGPPGNSGQDGNSEGDGHLDENTSGGATAATPGLLPIAGGSEQPNAPVALSSPLNNLDPLRNALPDVTGHVGTVE
mmetsp:Transcript_5525/g.8735  ORF Transcript_5525/g.8735 Transcript_5525/m.8735 type:complete len:614 (-) Transcript_5525:52-1893(-)